jgi:predicted nucleic acid-binding protein
MTEAIATAKDSHFVVNDITFSETGQIEARIKCYDNPLEFVHEKIRVCEVIYEILHRIVKDNAARLTAPHQTDLKEIIDRYTRLVDDFHILLNNLKVEIQNALDCFATVDQLLVSTYGQHFKNMGGLVRLKDSAMSLLQRSSDFLMALATENSYVKNMNTRTISTALIASGLTLGVVAGILFLPTIALASYGVGTALTGLVCTGTGAVVRKGTFHIDDVIAAVKCIRADTKYVSNCSNLFTALMNRIVKYDNFDAFCETLIQECDKSLARKFFVDDVFQ